MNGRDLALVEGDVRASQASVAESDDRRISRTRLWDTPETLVEDLHCDVARGRAPLRSFSSQYQICLPYRGLFVWHVGEDDVIADSNQVLFVSGGEPYRVTRPLPTAYAELILTPDPELLEEIAGAAHMRLRYHPLFRRRRRRADMALLAMRARLLRVLRSGQPLHADELVIRLLRAALAGAAPVRDPGMRTRGLIRRAKEFVNEHLSAPLRLRDVAGAVGASPAYLTDVFRKMEGIPLHRYVTQLRLARGLVELPHADDLTGLAFELGFSSHSHFAAAFRKAFGCTPSEFRASARIPNTHADPPMTI